MLLCGIIDELVEIRKDTNTNLSFFFCQAHDHRINNATAVLRGLIYMLVTQQKELISHLRESYDHFGKQLFEDPNSRVALSRILAKILDDSRLRTTFIVIDGLDECTGDPTLLLEFVARNSSKYPKVKWLVSSRNWPSIEKNLHAATHKAILSLELNEESVSAAVTTFIQSKVAWLARENGYSDDDVTRTAVERYLSANAHGTFLWVALVCEGIKNSRGWEVEELLSTFPDGLNALYRRMMDQICSDGHAKLLKRILAALLVVHRPITLDELTAVVEIPPKLARDDKGLEHIIQLCGSFLTLRARTVSFVHQSAKDYLLGEADGEIFPDGIQAVHSSVFSRSLRAMSDALGRDIYILGAPGIPIDKIKPPDPDPLAAVRYSCVYWVDHLRDCEPHKNAADSLRDGGSIDAFLRQTYLHWLEALSLLKHLTRGAASMVTLSRLVEVSFSSCSLRAKLTYSHLGRGRGTASHRSSPRCLSVCSVPQIDNQKLPSSGVRLSPCVQPGPQHHQTSVPSRVGLDPPTAGHIR